jgi:hypothetical protein
VVPGNEQAPGAMTLPDIAEYAVSVYLPVVANGSP